MSWIQVYEPLGPWLSTLCAALPIVLLLVLLGVFEWRAHNAALLALIAALATAIVVFGMPAHMALITASYGAAYGFLPIGWIVLNAVFLYNLTVETGQFDIVKQSVGHLSQDKRIQALLIAFSFGAFIEGAAGFGTPVAICSALLMGLGFTPLHAAGLSLIANTAPVAFGAIGTPILTLGAVTGLDPHVLGMMAGRQLPFISLIIPAWLMVVMSGWKGLREVWREVLVCGGSFAVVQFVWSNFVGPELVDIIAGITSMLALGLYCRMAKPRNHDITKSRVARAWMPWVFLSICVMVWGLVPVKRALTSSPILAPKIQVPELHHRVYRDYPVEPHSVDRARINDTAYRSEHAEPAVYTVNWASATGTAILFAALLTILYLRIPLALAFAVALRTVRRMRGSVLTIMLMLALGFVTRYGGTDATLGLAFTKTGMFYPFFATFLGWLGVALTGSDTSSNVLFGSLQQITAQQLGFSPVLITTANSTGGVMGKMIDAQSIVVSTAATGQTGQEGKILRFVFWHSVALATIMALIVVAQAYWLKWMVP